MDNPFRNDPFSMLWKAFKNLYPDKDCQCWFDLHLEGEDSSAFGFTNFPDDGGIPQVFIYADYPMNILVEIFAHELAHVAVGKDHEHDSVWEQALTKLYDEYTRIGDELLSRKSKEV